MEFIGRRRRARLERRKRTKQVIVTIIKCVTGFGLAYANLIGILLLFG